MEDQGFGGGCNNYTAHQTATGELISVISRKSTPFSLILVWVHTRGSRDNTPFKKSSLKKGSRDCFREASKKGSEKVSCCGLQREEGFLEGVLRRHFR